MNAAFARSAPIILALTIGGLLCAARAQDLPAAQYELRQADPDLGSNIKRNSVRGASISLDLPYGQLPEDNKQAVHSWWAVIAPGDEPPFPFDGLRALFDPIGKAHAKLAQSGTLRVSP